MLTPTEFNHLNRLMLSMQRRRAFSSSIVNPTGQANELLDALEKAFVAHATVDGQREARFLAQYVAQGIFCEGD